MSEATDQVEIPETQVEEGAEIQETEVSTPAEETVESADETVSIEDIASDKVAEKPKDTTPKWAKNRFGELTKKIKDRDAEIESLKSKSVSSERQLPPDRDDFKTGKDYQKAMMDWKDSDDDWKSRTATSKKIQEEFESRSDKNLQRYMESTERMKTKYTDYEDIVEGAYYDHVAPLILESEFSPEIGYYLAKNPTELERIKSLPQYGAAMEIGKLEAKLVNVQKKSTTTAPTPINTLEGNDAPKKELTAENSSIDDWMENDKKQRLAKIKSKYE